MALEDAVVLARSVAAHGTEGLAAYEAGPAPAGRGDRQGGRSQQQREDPGRLGRVPLETMLSLLFRSGVAARSTDGFTAHRLGAGLTSQSLRRRPVPRLRHVASATAPVPPCGRGCHEVGTVGHNLVR